MISSMVNLICYLKSLIYINLSDRICLFTFVVNGRGEGGANTTGAPL